MYNSLISLGLILLGKGRFLEMTREPKEGIQEDVGVGSFALESSKEGLACSDVVGGVLDPGNESESATSPSMIAD